MADIEDVLAEHSELEQESGSIDEAIRTASSVETLDDYVANLKDARDHAKALLKLIDEALKSAKGV